MSERITAYLFSTDENFTAWPTMDSKFFDELCELDDTIDKYEPGISIVNYITDEFIDRTESDFKQFIETANIADDTNVILFMHTNINDPKLLVACTIFAQFTGVGFMRNASVYYGKNGNLIFVANNISLAVNSIIDTVYINNNGWFDISYSDRPPMFDILFDYLWNRSKTYHDTISTNENHGDVFQLYIITSDIDEYIDECKEYYDVMHICELIDVRFGDTGTSWPRIKPMPIKYSDFLDKISEDCINAYDFAFMWATPNCDGKGLSDEDSDELRGTICSLWDSLVEINGDDFQMTQILRTKPNGDKVIIIGSKNAELDRINNADLLMSRIMTMYFNGRTD